MEKLILSKSFTSYYFQIIVLLCAWVALRLFQSWTQILCFCFYCFHLGRQDAWKKAKSYQTSVSRNGQHAALLTSTVELQKAQCFFMIAIQIAALLAIKEINYFKLESYEHLVHTLVLVYNVAAAGIVPIVFGLFILHLSNMKSSFIYCLTALTVSVSSVTRHYKNFVEIGPDDVDGPQRKPISCGGYPGPSKYCRGGFDLEEWIPGARARRMEASGRYYAPESRSIDKLFYFSIAVLVILFFNQFPLIQSIKYGQERQARWMTVFEWLRLRFLNMPPIKLLDCLRIQALKSRIRMVSCFQAISIVLADVTFIYFLSYQLVELRKLSRRIHSFEAGWDVGQIVAVMVLIPPVVEYIYLASRKYCMVGPKKRT